MAVFWGGFEGFIKFNVFFNVSREAFLGFLFLLAKIGFYWLLMANGGFVG